MTGRLKVFSNSLARRMHFEPNELRMLYESYGNISVTTNQLQYVEWLLRQRVQSPSQPLRNIITRIDRSCFIIVDGTQMKSPLIKTRTYPIRNTTVKLEKELNREFVIDLYSLSVLNIERGDSFLCVQSQTGYTNQVAAHLIGPGGVNIGVEARVAFLQHSRNISAAIFRRNPALINEVTMPTFTNDSRSVVWSSRVFDKILFNLPIPVNDLRIEVLKAKLRPGGKLLTWDQEHPFLFIAQLFERRSNGSITNTRYELDTSFTTNVMESLSPTVRDLWAFNSFPYPDHVPNLQPPLRSPLPLAELAVRASCVEYDPVKRLLDPQSSDLIITTVSRSYTFQPMDAEINELVSHFRHIVDAAFMSYYLQLHSESPLTATYLDAMFLNQFITGFITKCLAITNLLYSDNFNEESIRIDHGMMPATAALNAESLVSRLTMMNKVLFTRPFESENSWTIRSHLADILSTDGVQRFQSITSAALLRRVTDLGEEHFLFASVDQMSFRKTRILEMWAARFVSDFKAVHKAVQLLPRRGCSLRLTRQRRRLDDLRSQLPTLINEIRGVHNGALFLVIRHCSYYFDQFVTAMNLANNEIPLDENLNMPECTFGILCTFLDSNIVAHFPGTGVGRRGPMLSPVGRVSVDIDVFDEELERLDSQVPSTLESDDELADLLAARFVDDCQDFIARVKLEAARMEAEHLIANREAYADRLLSDVPQHTRSLLTRPINMSRLFFGEVLDEGAPP